MKDAHSGFEGQLALEANSNVVSPRKITTDSETKKFQLLNFFMRIVKNGGGRGCQMVLADTERERESRSVRFARIEGHFSSL